MSTDLILLIIFGIILLIFILTHKKKVEFQKILGPVVYFVLYRTKIGLVLMDKLAKRSPRFLNVLAYVSISVGFIGMAFILYFLVQGAYGFFFQNQPSPVGLILPGVKVPGLPTLSFFHWIAAIFILAVVHEFSHGVFARLYDIKIKSSGFAFFGIILPIIPAAFVEPDEKQLVSAPKKQQLAILSAGSFANVITALVFLLILFFVMTPGVNSVVELKGVTLAIIEDNSPAFEAGMQAGEEVISINNIEIKDIKEFTGELSKLVPHQKVTIVTKNNTYTPTLGENPDNSSKSYLGVQVTPTEKGYTADALAKYGKIPLDVFMWLSILVMWAFIANLGVGLFNLLPLGPLDGGKMFHVALQAIFKDEKKVKVIWGALAIFLVILLIILLAPQLYNLLLKPIIGLF
ncbi:MAG: site-2 protease family protein [Candidatus Woesearchaeota archaeon]